MPKRRTKSPGTTSSKAAGDRSLNGDAGKSKKTLKDAKSSRGTVKSKGKKGKALKVKKLPEAPETTEVEGEQEEEDVEVEQSSAVELDEDPSNIETISDRFGLPEWNVPCSYFFQQQGAMDFESYLTLKDEEKHAGVYYTAARTIQAAWRGFITRYKLKILNLAAIKIQTYVRGFLARRRVAKIRKEKAEELDQKNLNEAATKIQAAWRGYWSRKTKLNFKDYKEIQDKNKALKKSIESINKLENALLGDSMNDLRDGTTDLSTLSAARVAELHAYASDWGNRPSFDMPEPLTPKGWDGTETSTSKKFKSLKRFSAGSRPPCTDSVDDLFPDFPNKDGLIRPDPAKVEALKQAIRLLKKKAGMKEERELQKVHHLLRTNRPGVYSDIYCNELTEFEKQVKSVKYWTPPPDPRIKKKPAKSSMSEKKDLESLYEDEGETLSSPVNGHAEETEEGGQGDFLTNEESPKGFEANENFEMYPKEIHA